MLIFCKLGSPPVGKRLHSMVTNEKHEQSRNCANAAKTNGVRSQVTTPQRMFMGPLSVRDYACDRVALGSVNTQLQR